MTEKMAATTTTTKPKQFNLSEYVCSRHFIIPLCLMVVSSILFSLMDAYMGSSTTKTCLLRELVYYVQDHIFTTVCTVLHAAKEAYINPDYQRGAAALALLELQIIFFIVTKQLRADIYDAIVRSYPVRALCDAYKNAVEKVCEVVRTLKEEFNGCISRMEGEEAVDAELVKQKWDNFVSVIRNINGDDDEKSIKAVTKYVKLRRPAVTYVMIDGVVYELRRKDASPAVGKGQSRTILSFFGNTDNVVKTPSTGRGQQENGSTSTTAEDVDKGINLRAPGTKGSPFICNEDDDIPEADEDGGSDTDSLWSGSESFYEDTDGEDIAAHDGKLVQTDPKQQTGGIKK